MPVVTNTVTRPGGALAVGLRVRIRLVASDPVGEAGFVASADQTIIGEWWTLTDAAGLWSATLEANAALTPSSTVYEIVEGPGSPPYYVEVPNGAGPYWAGDLIVGTPGAPGGSALGVPVRVLLARWDFTVSAPQGNTIQLGLGPRARTTIYDAGVTDDAGYLVLPFAGVYLVSAALEWSSNAGTSRYLYLDAAGSSGPYNPEQLAPAGYTMLITSVLHYASTANLDLIGIQYGGGALNLTGAWISIIGWATG